MTTKTALFVGLFTALTVAPAAAGEIIYPDGNGNVVVQDKGGSKRILVGRGPSAEETMTWVKENADRYPPWLYYGWAPEGAPYWGPYYSGLYLPRGQSVYDDGKGNVTYYDNSGSKRIAVGRGASSNRKLAAVAPQGEDDDADVILAQPLAVPKSRGSVVYYCPPELTRSGKGNGRTALSKCDD